MGHEVEGHQVPAARAQHDRLGSERLHGAVRIRFPHGDRVDTVGAQGIDGVFRLQRHDVLRLRVEADHFAWAVRGLNLALAYTPEAEREPMRQQAIVGFQAFERDHLEFFERVGA